MLSTWILPIGVTKHNALILRPVRFVMKPLLNGLWTLLIKMSNVHAKHLNDY